MKDRNTKGFPAKGKPFLWRAGHGTILTGDPRRPLDSHSFSSVPRVTVRLKDEQRNQFTVSPVRAFQALRKVT